MKLKLVAGVTAASIGLVGAPAPAVAGPEPGRFTQVDEYLNAYAEQNDLPGLAAAVIGPDGVEHKHLRGVDGNGDPITEDTSFLIGSIAKSMTATIVMQLERQGKLALDEHVSDHIDFLPDGDPTIRQLLTHTAGFTIADGIAAADRYDNEPGAIRRAVESLEHSGTVDEYAYTSADYLVLGAIVESITGRPYGDVLKSDLLEPLGMHDSAADEQAAEDLPPGHRFWWGQPVRHDPDFDESGTPYASVTSTLTDLGTYATAQLRGDAIPADIREQTQQSWVKSSKHHYGLGWSVTELHGKPIVHHTGANPGYFSHVYLVPDQGRAIVILTNAYSEARGPSLVAGAGDIWRILEGEDREPAASDAVLSALSWILTAVAACGLALAVLSLWRPAGRRRRFAATAACLLVGAVLWLLPGFFGYDLRALRIWLPDGAWALIAGLVLWVLASLLWLLPAGTHHRFTHRAPTRSRPAPHTARSLGLS
ncbi:class A beta-lactamase-related serine hydrolase [Micromonospora sp. KC606]|uniref:serine hydrolase domain-containing protein n=1 Tax=Micromonospora sp. KC606 TaxID=2530379 RepID=UPI00104A8162|nr:serine hydrolase domain-containing protein [Micromonospora sp. KC606]TDC85303.1 class A beta-lactamase-related serine hydrolase [Micromonospora sp. KC606]